MPYCPKCGAKVGEEMAFCSKCGASLKVEKPSAEAAPAPALRRAEKAEKYEKREKEEKREKGEKHEKRGWGITGPLIAGLVLIFLGVLSYLGATGYQFPPNAGPFFLIIVGILVIAAVAYGILTAGRRSPKT